MNILYSWICDLTSFTPWQHVLHVGLCNFRGVVVSGSLIDCRPKEDTQKGEENVLPMNSHGITRCSMVLEKLDTLHLRILLPTGKSFPIHLLCCHGTVATVTSPLCPLVLSYRNSAGFV